MTHSGVYGSTKIEFSVNVKILAAHAWLTFLQDVSQSCLKR